VLEWRHVAAVALGGMLGCVARYAAGLALTRGPYPWGTVAVNIVGSFALGYLVFSDVAERGLSAEARLFLTTGFLGGFTTMSSFAVETVGLWAERERAWAGAHWALNAGVTLLAALAGRAVAAFA
jgi:fluoride exporter